MYGRRVPRQGMPYGTSWQNDFTADGALQLRRTTVPGIPLVFQQHVSLAPRPWECSLTGLYKYICCLKVSLGGEHEDLLKSEEAQNQIGATSMACPVGAIRHALSAL